MDSLLNEDDDDNAAAEAKVTASGRKLKRKCLVFDAHVVRQVCALHQRWIQGNAGIPHRSNIGCCVDRCTNSTVLITYRDC